MKSTWWNCGRWTFVTPTVSYLRIFRFLLSNDDGWRTQDLIVIHSTERKRSLHACRFSPHNPINNCLVRHQTFISDCLALDTREWVDGLMGETSSIVSTCGSSIHSHQTSHKDKHKPKPLTTPFGPTALARKASRAHIVAQTPNPRSNENLIYSISHTGINILV
jgi:hypothetical protein